LTLDRKRWLVIAAGILADVCMGAGYAFSVFKKDLIDVLHCTPQQVTLAYSLSFAFLPVGMLIGGAISRRISPRAAVVIGGAIFAGGVIAAGFVRSVALLCVTYGFMVAVGNGIVYATVIAVAVRWFPDRKGMASGAVVAALGAGTLVIARVGQSLVTDMGVQNALKLLGVAFLAAALIASRLIIDPPKGYAPSGWNPPSQENGTRGGNDVTWREMLTKPAFWVLFAVYVCGAAPGLLLISEAKEVAINLTRLGEVAAASMVGVLGGVANATGRLGWGAVSDRIGRLNALTAMLVITGLAMLAMPHIASASHGLWLGYALVGLCYGGTLGTFPSVCADRFGSRNIEVNYALLFVAFGLAGILGPWFGAELKAVTGGYTGGFIFSAALAGVGLLLSLTLRVRRGGDKQI
jgi:OFA family oxalate/formate antiporter-like MFS transporter